MPNLAVIQAPDGSIREVPIGVVFRLQPGERVIGRRVVVQTILQQALSQEGLGVGDAVAWLTNKLGIHPDKDCNCKKRQASWNKWRIRL